MMFAVVAMCGYAQNANRSGFFLEIGAGSVVGESSYTDTKEEFSVIDGSLAVISKVKRDNGFKFNVGTGYRLAVSNNWAIELKAMGVKYNDIAVKLMPGARYTSKELFSNVSMYIAPNIGACLYIGDYHALFGLGYSLGLGLNLTERISIGAVFEGHYLFDDIWWTDLELESPNWGTIGINIGYRF